MRSISYILLSIVLAFAQIANGAIGATAIWEVRPAAATTNGGGFNPGSSNLNTNLAATNGNTASPVVSSATYNFAAGDVGKYIFIKSGTNWRPGWYQIASVATNVATLSAAIGAAFTDSGDFDAYNTAAGCASVASPTNGTWSMDYTLTDTVVVNVADGVTAASTTITSATAAFTQAMRGHVIYVAGGTAPITATRREITGVTNATTIVVDAAMSGASTGTTLVVGGAIGDPALTCAFATAGNDIWLKSGSTYSISSSSSNVAGGRLTLPSTSAGTNVSKTRGYNTTRGDQQSANAANRPILQATASMGGSAVVTLGSTSCHLESVDVDGNSQATTVGVTATSGSVLRYVKARRCTTGINCGSSPAWMILCEATLNTTAGFTLAGSSGIYCYGSTAHDNTAVGFNLTGFANIVRCQSYLNTGATTDGFVFSSSSGGSLAVSSVAYANGRHGFSFTGSPTQDSQLIDCVSTAHAAGYGFTASSVKDSMQLMRCAGYSNSSGDYNLTNFTHARLFVTLSADPFTNAAAGNFAPNATAGGGALLRAGGSLGVFPGGASTGAIDIGAVQSAAGGEASHALGN